MKDDEQAVGDGDHRPQVQRQFPLICNAVISNLTTSSYNTETFTKTWFLTNPAAIKNKTQCYKKVLFLNFHWKKRRRSEYFFPL